MTNPFTVLLASNIIGVNPMRHVFYRIIIFAVMYVIVFGMTVLYIKKIRKDPTASLTYEHDKQRRISADLNVGSTNSRIIIIYSIFLFAALVLIIISSSVAALRDYTVVILSIYFLVFGIAAGAAASKDLRSVLKSFGRGFVGALPTLVFIALASSVKYIFDEASTMPTIVWQINKLTAGKNVFVVAAVIYLIILVLEFFISSSTAKAILVMGILSVTSVGLSKTMLVLIYTFADGYTNLIFPTSPVLLISLSMIGVDYFKWIKKSVPLFAVNLLAVVAFVVIGILIKY